MKKKHGQYLILITALIMKFGRWVRSGCFQRPYRHRSHGPRPRSCPRRRRGRREPYQICSSSYEFRLRSECIQETVYLLDTLRKISMKVKGSGWRSVVYYLSCSPLQQHPQLVWIEDRHVVVGKPTFCFPLSVIRTNQLQSITKN